MKASRLLHWLLWPFLLPAIGAVWLFVPRARPHFRERLGLAAGRPGQEPCLLLHVASLGEARAARTLIERLSARVPLVLTTMTATGREALASAHPGIPVSLAPLDLPGLWVPFLSSRRVRAILLFETEVWPAMILSARSLGIPAGIVNGRLSTRSHRRYRRLAFLVRPLFSFLAPVLVSEERDRERFQSLGVREEALAVTGNLKWDLALAEPDDPRRIESLRSWLNRQTPPSANSPLLLAGSSVHPGEARRIVEACLAARQQGIRIHPVLALRHLERLPELVASLPKMATPRLRTAGPSPDDPDTLPVYILDTYGELGWLLGEADMVVVGGTLDPVGGHSPVEAAYHGKPLLLGPHQDHIAALVDPLRSEGATLELPDPSALEPALIGLARSPERRRTMGEAARRVFDRLGGPIDRTMAGLKPVLALFPEPR
uniref:3-deoxy-D-manno-octulosonic acid transferase n=1 Tax=Leptospirillum ferrodiazotrophum TaxID=412449 RepID=C6I0H3_9BACT|nr:MAG: Three-deoxy-D-manno-octulosonic-acid transferase domain protein [Leptospirillum ferrodiazotrophum]